MYLITLLPLSESALGDVTYISSTGYPSGSVISAPWRSGSIQGVVVKTEEAVAMKSFLRQATFQVRRIPESPVIGWAPLYLLESIRALAVTKGVLPAPLAAKLIRVSEDPVEEPTGAGYGEQYIEGPFKDRIAHYHSLLQHERLLIIVPTLEEVRLFKGALPGAYVTTIAGVRALPPNITTIVVERESSDGYLMKKRPYADMRDLIALIASRQELPLVWADDLIRLEQCGDNPVIALGTPPQPVVIERTKEDGSGISLPEEALAAIDAAVQQKKVVFIYAARSGHAQSIVCRDCGTLHTCSVCASPLRLRTTKNVRIFWCPRCHSRETTESKCRVCDSWNLIDLGIGSEKIAEELQRFDPLLVDTFHGSPTATRKRIALKLKTGGVIIGTQTALRYLTHIDLAMVPSIDSLVTLPHWRSRESLARNMATLCARAERTVIYTRQDKAALATLFTSGKEVREIERGLRKRFGYPPYIELLGIITQKELPRLRTLPHSEYVGESRSHIHGKPVFLMRFRVPHPLSIASALLALPQSVRVEWNPEWW